MKFNSYEERKKHPQAGIIPDYVWNIHFYGDYISDELLKLISLSEDELCEEPRKIELGEYAIITIFLAIICSHKDLSKNALNIIINKVNINCEAAFFLAAECGSIEFLQFLEALFSNKLQVMIKAYNYAAFRHAAQTGHVNVLEYLEKKAPDLLQDMIKAQDYSAFRLAAQNGHVKVLEYLEKKAPTMLQEMIKAQDYYAFRLAAENGHVKVLEYLETKIQHPATLQDMIKADDYKAFLSAAQNGHIKVLEYLEKKAPDLLLNMIKADNYDAFSLAAMYGHVNALEYLAGKAPSLLQDMIKARDYYAFRLAAIYGRVNVLEYLETKIQPKVTLQEMIQANNYEAFCLAAAYGHANTLNFLMRYNAVRLDAFSLIAWGLSNNIWTKSSHLDLKELLKHPAMFEHACSHHSDAMKLFIDAQIQELRARPLHGNPLHRLHNKQEAECLFYLLHHLIERVGIEAKDDILFLLSIKELQAILPTTRPPQNTTNLALRAAITKRHSAREGAAIWNEIISAFYDIPEVSAQAQLDHHYSAETRGQLDLRAIASNTESSMQALTAEEEAELKQLRDHYQPQIDELTKGGPDLLWSVVLSHFDGYYNENKATFTNTQGEVITLPLEWDAFQNLHLSLEDNKLAREAYYQNKAHTAYRFFLRPNPWLASNASHVEVLTTGGRAANYENLKEIITLLTLAAFDDKMKPLDDSGFDLKGRINIFVDAIALMNRAHNWDKTRERISRRLSLGPTNSLVIKECYDDLEGDKPSCLPGMKKRLIQSLVAHPLFISTNVIAEEAVRCELQNIIKDKITTLDNAALTNLHDYLQDIISTGSSDISAAELIFDETCHQTLIANILKEYFWLDAEILKSEIVKTLKALRLVKEAPINSNLFITGDFFTYTQGQIRNIAKEKNIELLVSKAEDVETQKELSVLESVKHLVAHYCTQNPALSSYLAVFANATNEQELKDAWEQWTPDSTPTHRLANDFQTLYPALFVAKCTPGQMTYDDLPDWYQELIQEEKLSNTVDKDFILKTLTTLEDSCKLYLKHASNDSKHQDKRKTVREIINLMGDKPKDAALVLSLKKYLDKKNTVSILSQDLQSKGEFVVKILAAISVVFGLALAIKRLVETKGKSANFFKPLSKTYMIEPILEINNIF